MAETQEVHGIRFPAEIEVPEWAWYRIDYGSNEVWDLGWEGHVDMAHQIGVTSIDTELVDSGVDDNGIIYAAVQATVVLEDGGTFTSISGADETSQQVRDPEYVWSVAESRALKRAIKKALNLAPVNKGTEEDDSGGSSGGSVEKGPDGPKINPPPEFESDGDDVGADAEW